MALAALDDLRDKEVRAREKLADVRSELSGLRKVDASLSDASPLTARVVSNHPDAIAARLGDVIEAPVEIEGLVEQLLAGDIDALVCMSGPALARAASFALEAGDATGEALLLARDVDAPAACDGALGYRLVERLQVRDGYAPAVAALLGHVYMVDTLDEALAAPALPGVLYVTPQGARVRDGGVVRVGALSGAAAGSLERKRRIRELERFEPELVAVFDRAVERVAEAADAIEQARAAERDAAGSISRLEGERSSLLSEVGRMEHSLSVKLGERSNLARRREEAAAAVREAQPRVDELEQTRDEARERLDDLGRRIAEAQDDLERVRRDDAEAGSKLADAKVRLARANERVKSLSARVPELERRLEGIDRRIRGTEQSARSLEVLRLRVDPLHDRYQALSERAMDWAARLRDRASLEEADSASLKRTIEDAKGEVARAKVEVDLATAAVNDAKVARGKLRGAGRGRRARHHGRWEHRARGGAAASRPGRPRGRRAGAQQPRASDQQPRPREPGGHGGVRDPQAARRLHRGAAGGPRERAQGAHQDHRGDRPQDAHELPTTFEKVDENFREVFSMLFSGGQAHLEMTDPEHPAETGIEVVAQPRGKRITKMMLMSGGEKSLTALALLFAVYRTRTVPFYVLDEVEAALDDSNLSKLIGAIDYLRKTTQLLVISHQRRTMEDADVLYGVSMQADGVSRVVSQKLDRETGKVVNA